MRKSGTRRVMAMVLAVGLWAGCATTAEMTPTRVNPAAVGTIELDRGGDGENNSLVIEVQHMAPPQRLDDDLTTYVVWLRSPGQKEWANAGQLKLGDDRTGRLALPTPFEALDVLVTAEPGATVQTPGSTVVLQGAVEADS